MKKTHEMLNAGTVKFNAVKEGIARKLSSNRGDAGPIVAIIFAAIIILAVLATDPTVRGVFTNATTSFSSWLSTKLTALFS